MTETTKDCDGAVVKVGDTVNVLEWFAGRVAKVRQTGKVRHLCGEHHVSVDAHNCNFVHISLIRKAVAK